MGLFKRLKASPALIVASIALFVALTGTAVATTTQLITGVQIKNSSITGADVKNSSITGADVKNKSLTPKDFKGSVRGARGPAGPAGTAGPAGAAGAAGAQGPIGPSDAFSRFRNGPVSLQFATKPSIGHLDIPLAGNYVVFAKAWIENDAGVGTSEVECDLVLSSGDFDRGRVGLQDQNVGPEKHGTMALNAVGAIAAGGGADLNCRNFGGGITLANFIKITAIRVGSLTNTSQT